MKWLKMSSQNAHSPISSELSKRLQEIFLERLIFQLEAKFNRLQHAC